MTESAQPEKKPGKKKKSLIWRIIKWSFILLFILFCIFTALTRIGGDSPVIRDALEDMMSEQLGYHVQIGTFNKMTFFPLIAIDAQDVYFYAPRPYAPAPEEGESGETTEGAAAQTPVPSGPAKARMTLGKMQVAFGFFDVMMGNGRIRHLDIENLEASPGALIPPALHIESAYLTALNADNEKEAEHGFFKVRGSIGEQPLDAIFTLKISGLDRYRAYSVGEDRNFLINIGDYKIAGRLEDKLLGGMTLSDGLISNAQGPVLSAQAQITHRKEEGLWDLKGETRVHGHGSVLTPDITVKKTAEILKVNGAVSGEKVVWGDFANESAVRRAANDLFILFSSGDDEQDKGIDYSGLDVNLDLDFAHAYYDGIALEGVKVPLVIKDNILSLDPLEGSINDGDLSGGLKIDASGEAARLDADMLLKNIDYGALQEKYLDQVKLEGSGHMRAQLQSTGGSYGALKDNVGGTLTAVAGKGQLYSGILDIWGGGLLGALIPGGENETFDVNCGVLDLDIENHIASTKSLFVDMKTIRVSGDGEYDIGQDRLDLELTPQSKDISIMPVGTPVHLRGPLSEPEVIPSAMGVGKKIGGLLLSAVNPAFSAVTLVDLGLGDDHPCKDFMIESETLDAPPAQTSEEPQEELPEEPQE